jgi:hypothetical protein
MENFKAPPKPSSDVSAEPTNITLFLGLSLLILAFFIILVSISSFEENKSKAVIDSLDSAFESVRSPEKDISVLSGAPLESQVGAVLSGAQLQSQLSKLFVASIKAVQIKIVKSGKMMRIVFPSGALFLDGDVKIRPDQFALLDRIVSSLSVRPPGRHYEMQFVIGSYFTSGKNLPVGQSLEMSRAGAFVQAMLSRGAPPDSLSIGMEPGDPKQITIWFNVRLPDELLLKPLPPESVVLPAEQSP